MGEAGLQSPTNSFKELELFPEPSRSQLSILSGEATWVDSKQKNKTKQNITLQQEKDIDKKSRRDFLLSSLFLYNFKMVISIVITIKPIQPISFLIFLKTHPGKRSEQAPHQEDVQMANKHTKRCSTLCATREVQVETAVRYHDTPVKMPQIQNTRSIKHWRGCGGRGTGLNGQGWWEGKMSVSKTV